jgi:hypothetical protein
MFSILSANPNLQSLVLLHGSIPNADSDRSSSQMQLRHLKRLHLGSDIRRVFGLLNQLKFPDKMGDLNLSLRGCSPSNLPQTLGPYLGNHIRRRSPDRLRLFVEPGFDDFSINVGVACDGDSTQEVWFMVVGGGLSMTLREEEADKLCLDVIAHIPQEVGEGTTTLPSYDWRSYASKRVDLSKWFVEPDTRKPHIFKDIFRGLRSIAITRPALIGDDWGPLMNFLARRAAVGNRISSLSLRGYLPMGEDVVESIRRAVEVFEDGGSDIRDYDSDSYTGDIELPFD